MMIKNDNQIVSAISNAIQREIESIIDEEAKAAAKRTEERIRLRATAIAGCVLERFSIERFGSELRITVNFENTKT